MKGALLLALAASCSGYTLSGAAPRPHAAARRASAPVANLFENLGKIAEYNKKYISTAMSSMFDDRTAKASHILFSFEKYEDGAAQAASLKSKIEAGELSFADAAKEYSTCPSAARGGDLGTFKKGAMVPEFDATVFDEATPLGGSAVQGPVKTQFGCARLRAHAPPHTAAPKPTLMARRATCAGTTSSRCTRGARRAEDVLVACAPACAALGCRQRPLCSSSARLDPVCAPFARVSPAPLALRVGVATRLRGSGPVSRGSVLDYELGGI